MPKYEYIYKTNYTVSIVMCVMMLNMRMCIRRCLPAASVSIFFVFPFPIPRESQLAIQSHPSPYAAIFPRTMCCYFCERAAEHYSFVFDGAPCAAAIFQNELSDCIALFLTEHHVPERASIPEFPPPCTMCCSCCRHCCCCCCCAAAAAAATFSAHHVLLFL